MIPLKDENPKKNLPFINFIFILVNITVYIYQPSSEQLLRAFYNSYGLIPNSFTNINVNDLPHFLATIQSLFTSLFVHGGFMHLAGNMLFLWVFGDNIEYAIGQYEGIVGCKPLAFRAGGYGADKETLEVLMELGIKYDSSYLYKKKTCKLNEAGILKKINEIAGYKDIIEIPITVYADLGMLLLRHYIKIDINGTTPMEIKNVLKQNGKMMIKIATMHKNCPIQRFFNSLDPNGKWGAAKAGRKKTFHGSSTVEEFEALLDCIRETTE